MQQPAAALIALGMYKGEDGQAEHDAEAERPGQRLYQLRLAGALLGAAQSEAMLAKTLAAGAVDLAEAHDQQLVTAGVRVDSVKLAAFLQFSGQFGGCDVFEVGVLLRSAPPSAAG